MIQVSRAHWLVTANILGELLRELDRTRFQAGPAEFGVRTATGVRYPDAIVDRASAGLGDLACEAPILIVEVLSPSTAGLDFTVKLEEYKAITSVQTYLICSPDEPRAWVWLRQGDGPWPAADGLAGPKAGSARRSRHRDHTAVFRGIPDALTPA
jgi:Uma2 family endonuclease